MLIEPEHFTHAVAIGNLLRDAFMIAEFRELHPFERGIGQSHAAFDRFLPPEDS
jgi:hypothetical protein